jgi:hypothetical protein
MKLRIYRLFVFLFIYFVFIQPYVAQKTEYKRPEIIWAITHPFIACKAKKISNEAVQISSQLKDERIDNDKNGGQADAFRHAIWMAMLCKKIHWKKALSLGKAHEKSNYIDYKRKNKEEGIVPDKASVEMDLYNNKAGVLIGRELKKKPLEETQEAIILAILNGQFKIIKKDNLGNSLDSDGNIIHDDEWLGKWENKRVLVPSSFKKN